MHLGFCCLLEGRYRDAVQVSEAMLSRTPTTWGYYQLAQAQLRLGRVADARRTAVEASSLGNREVLMYSIHGLIAAAERDRAGAQEQVALIQRNEKLFGHYHHAENDVACIHALLGEKDKALDWLTRAARNGFPCHGFFENDPLLGSLCSDERFTRLMRELKEECAGYSRVYSELPTISSGLGS